MTFNIDSDNDDSNRHFTWYKNGASGGGTGMMRLDENGRLVIGGDLATSANNITLKHATGVEIDMHATSGSGNNFRLKSDSGGIFTIRDHSAGADRLTIRDNGNIGIGDNDPSQKLNVAGNIMLEGGDQFMYLSNVGTGNAGIYVRGNSSSNFLRSHTTGMFTWEVAGSEKMRLASDGNVGINETNPIGDLSITGANGSTMEFQPDLTNGTNRITNYNRSTSTYKGFRLDASYLDFFISGAHRFSMGSTGQMEVSNSVSSNDAAVNIYKATGSNSDKAILRVGYDAAACFEVYRIRNNGDIFMGANQSGASVRLSTVPSGGSVAERVTILHDGRVGINNTNPPFQFTISEGAYSRITLNQSTTGKNWQMGNDGTRLYFYDASTSTRVLDLNSSSAQLRVYGTIASSAGDDSLKDFSAGRVMANRFRRGTSNGTRFGTVTGYIGDMLTSDGPALSNVFYMGQLNSSSSSNATQNMFSYYTSGHWGHYTAMRVWMHTDYYNHGYQAWDVYNGSITSIASRGSGGSISSTSTSLTSGAHSGQTVTRHNVTVNNPGTYFQVRWYLGLYFGSSVGVFSNAYSESSMDTYLSTRGSGIHFKGLSAAALSSSPMYRTQ